MHRWMLALVAVLLTGALCGPAVAQVPWPPYPQADPIDPHTIDRGPGWYLAWYKLLLLVLVFWGWLKLVDWLNRDATIVSERTGLKPQTWNPLVLSLFLAGFFAAVTIPLFLVGFAVYLLAAFVPLAIYLTTRNARVPPELRVLSRKGRRQEEMATPRISVPLEFRAAGADKDDAQSNLIRARQQPAFDQLATLLYEGISRRADLIMLDYTREQVAGRMRIDGTWHPLPACDRPSGDSMLVALKLLAGVNPAERRQRQVGQFCSIVRRLEVTCSLASQGVPTGERVLLKLLAGEKAPLVLAQLGMWPEMVQQLYAIVNSKGYVIVSALPGEGLTTTWMALLAGADRYTRDWVAIVDHDERETEMENIDVQRFDSRNSETPAKLLPSIFLRQPNAVAVPNPLDQASLDMLAGQVTKGSMTVVSRLHAQTATEALLRLMSMSGDRRQFAAAAAAAIGQRLVRRLCESCKQALAPNPKLVQQLGGNPRRPATLYTHWQPPPPEQRVDEKGRPIELPVCETCGGIGYIGRVAVYELVIVDETIRKAMTQTPQLQAVSAVVNQQGNKTMLQQAYRLVLGGITSVAEIKRVFSAQSGK